MAEQKASDISAIAKEIAKGYNAQIKELQKELNSIRKENIQNIKQVERLKDIVDKNKQSYQSKTTQSSEQIKELKSQINALKKQNSKQQSAVNGIKREYKKKFDSLKESISEEKKREREEAKAKAESIREEKAQERERLKQEKQQEKDRFREEKDKQKERLKQERLELQKAKELDKEKTQQAKYDLWLQDQADKIADSVEFNSQKSASELFKDFKKDIPKDFKLTKKDMPDFNKWASSTANNVSDNDLKELSTRIKKKDNPSNLKINKEVKEATNNFKDLNKQLDKINNKLNLFGAALALIRAWDWGTKHHEQTKSNIHSAYEAGLNYQQARHYNSVANTYGTDPQALTAEIKSFRMMKDKWGTGHKLFRSDEEQKFLFGGTRGSLSGLSIDKLASLDPVKGYELIAKTIYNDMKRRPNDAGVIEAMAHDSGYGVIASIMKKALIGGLDFNKVWKNLKNATDSPFGREQTAFKFSLELNETFARLANITDRLVMQFETLATKVLEFINKIPFLATATEKNEHKKETNNELVKKDKDLDKLNKNLNQIKTEDNGLFSTFNIGVQKVREFLGIKASAKEVGFNLGESITATRDKSHLDNDFNQSRLLMLDSVKKLATQNKTQENLEIISGLEQRAIREKDSLIGSDDTLYKIVEAIKKGDTKELDKIFNSQDFMKNQVAWNENRKLANSGSATQSYDYGQVNVQSNIILEDRTKGGVVATHSQTNSSTKVETIGQ